MARPIPLEIPARDPRAELRARLEQAPVQHAEALLAGYEVLQGLHDRGVLELARGMLGGGDKIVEALADAARSPDAIGGMRNLLLLAKLFARIPQEPLQELASGNNAKPPGLWSLLGRLRREDTRRTLGAALDVAEGLGKSIGRSD